MNKADFINGLGKSLAGKVDENEYRSQIEYYSSYIEGEIASGRREEDVLSELGDPRLIAKTIVQTYSMKDNPINRQFRKERYDEQSVEPDEDFGTTGKRNVYKVKHILRIILFAIVALLIVAAVTKMVLVVAPFLVMLLVVYLIVKFIYQSFE